MLRRLAAIMAADVVGFAHLMEQDEAGTLATLKAHRKEMIEPRIVASGGRIVKLMGDGALVEFASVVGAVECAIAVQDAMAERNASVVEERRVTFRIGINLGDVIVEDDADIYGDGVNVAARLGQLAPAGGVSGPVFEQIRDRVDAVFEDLGERRVKSLTRPIHVWRWLGTGAPRDEAPPDPASPLIPLGRPSLAVLPLDSLSDRREVEFLADGLTEDLTTLRPYSRACPTSSSFRAIPASPTRTARVTPGRSGASSACATWSRAACGRSDRRCG